MLVFHHFRLGMICLASLTVAQSAVAEDKVEIDPGLYQYNHIVKIGPQQIHAEDYQYCIFEGDNSRTLSQLVEALVSEGSCDVSNISFGGGKASADVSCSNTGLGFPLSGNLSANYAATQYDVKAVAQSPMGGPPITVTTDVKRIKACPADWTPPEGISPY